MTDRLILCLDGTWNSVFKPLERENKTAVLKPANPLKLARAVLPVDPVDGSRQIIYYDSGVGALGLYPGLSNKLLNFADSKLGGAWGAGFEANVEQATTFICNNYQGSMEIYVFGFSRGAAQARALCHFISWMGGIPEKEDAYYIPIFFRHYLKYQGGRDASEVTNSKGDVIADRIRKIEITFLGVWDTVSALGPRFRARKTTAVAEKSFHTRTSPAACIKHAYHAISIDERRFDFRPEIWTNYQSGQTMKQCWFAGAHGNVGGSYGNDGLANCALHWIIDAAKKHGLAVNETFLARYRAFPQDELGDPYGLTFKTVELLRFKLGHGKRPMQGYPKTANLEIHPSAIKRLCSDLGKFGELSYRYRPPELVAIAQKHKHNEKEFIRSFNLDPARYPYPSDI